MSNTAQVLVCVRRSKYVCVLINTARGLPCKSAWLPSTPFQLIRVFAWLAGGKMKKSVRIHLTSITSVCHFRHLCKTRVVTCRDVVRIFPSSAGFDVWCGLFLVSPSLSLSCSRTVSFWSPSCRRSWSSHFHFACRLTDYRAYAVLFWHWTIW
jgi:hypothetical protein